MKIQFKARETAEGFYVSMKVTDYTSNGSFHTPYNPKETNFYTTKGNGVWIYKDTAVIPESEEWLECKIPLKTKGQVKRFCERWQYTLKKYQNK